MTYRDHQNAILAAADKAAKDLSTQEYVDLLFETSAALDARARHVEKGSPVAEFYEDDESIEDLQRAFDEGQKDLTAPPSECERSDHRGAQEVIWEDERWIHWQCFVCGARWEQEKGQRHP